MSYRHLSLDERFVIHHLSLYGLSARQIGVRLGRHHATISREIVRNGPRPEDGVYVPEPAQARAQFRGHYT